MLLLLPCEKDGKGRGYVSQPASPTAWLLHAEGLEAWWMCCKPGMAGGESCSSGFLQFTPSHKSLPASCLI